MKHISEYLRDYYEERAGIVEHRANRPREEAEAAAMAEINERRARQDAVDRDKAAQR